jgi:hypothetical protein
MKIGNLDVTPNVTCAGKPRSKVGSNSLQPEHQLKVDNPTTVRYRVTLQCTVPGANPPLEYYQDNAFAKIWNTTPTWVAGYTDHTARQPIGRTSAPPGPAEFECHTVEIMHPQGAPVSHKVTIKVSVVAT